MLVWLQDVLRGPIDAWWVLRPLKVLDWVEFRAVGAVVLAFAIVVGLGPRVIRWLLMQKIGDSPEFYNKDLNVLMQGKANTPTMGGLLIAGAIFVVTVLLADLSSFYVLMGLIVLVALTAIGAADDWLKLTAARRSPGSREGLYSWEKFVLQVGLAVVIAIFIYRWGDTKQTGDIDQTLRMSRALNLPFLKSWIYSGGDWVVSPELMELPRWLFILVAVLFIVGFSNAANLTDGMDGLASGVTAIVAFAFAILAIIAGYQSPSGFQLAKFLLVPFVPAADELGVMSGAMVGACLGFLWFNCAPARVFMGDSGSLPLGGLLGYMAVVIRQELLLLVIGGIFVIEAGSVILQVGYFKLTGGKRIFRVAPIHHHFHLGGWTEQQVVVRFWLITALLAAIAIGTIKLR
ncbi:MAG: phospho-N-acetylmuramoyl-pentapeptide-transferase [Planctomycetota bacterium]